ncbi:MAG: flagellar FlbD family protein [Clostridiales bacterium]|jgi:flagellar protein FlbD|nr:flagellar FlbD family protein [Clostridiales bacterium]
MIELTDLNEKVFVLNSELIEKICCIPETKITLTDGKYFLVKESPAQIIEKVIQFKKKIKGK